MTNFVEIETGPWFVVHVSSKTALINENENDPINEMKTTKTKKVKTLTAAELIEARDALHEINQKMEELKVEQLEIRNYLADRLHDSDEGAKTMTIDGIKLTVTRVLNRTITRDEAARLQEEHPDLYAVCLNFRPEVRAGETKKHPEMEAYITSKPGPPSVVFA